MPICFAVPGFLCSELCTDEALRFPLWVEYSRLIQGEVGKLRLAPNGIDPGPPDGVQLYAGFPLGKYWDTPLRVLIEQIRPHGYRIVAMGYDWRKSILANGVFLADLIRERVTSADPCSIVAHSMGGLVARAAWWDLQKTEDENRVRRIVTLGTPHQGSYAPVMVMTGKSEELDQLNFLCNVVGGNLILGPIAPPVPRWNLTDLRRLALTWPALYSLMPALGGSGETFDPLRVKLFDKANWPSTVPVSQAHLDHSKTVFSPWLLDPATMPPSWVLTCVVGMGVPTPAKLVRPKLLGQAQALEFSPLGDGVVEWRSAALSASALYFVNCRHSDLPLTTAQSGDLAKWILEVRVNPDPPPPPVQVLGNFTPLIAGPPIPELASGGSAPTACDMGRCRC